jgi:hypothetical protein
MDERYFLHRYKASSHAAVVGGVLMGGWFLYQHIAHHQQRWDIIAIMGAMALTKLGFLLYYRLTD